MSEPTVSLRFPRRLHSDAKIEAARLQTSLQDFVEAAVTRALKKPGAPQPPSDLEKRLAALPEPWRKLVYDFITLMEIAPDFYLKAINKHVSGLLSVFRGLDKRFFESEKERA
ncbi:MAG: hypothetical protein WCB12_14120 [Bryobacteraceae bacterium]